MQGKLNLGRYSLSTQYHFSLMVFSEHQLEVGTPLLIFPLAYYSSLELEVSVNLGVVGLVNCWLVFRIQIIAVVIFILSRFWLDSIIRLGLRLAIKIVMDQLISAKLVGTQNYFNETVD